MTRHHQQRTHRRTSQLFWSSRWRRLALTMGAAALLAAGCETDDDTDASATEDPDDPDAAEDPASDETGGTDAMEGTDDNDEPDVDADADFERIETVMAETFADPMEEGLDRWQQEVEGIEDITIASSLDDHEQSALWLAPQSDEPQPLLVVLHTWSTPYLQHQGIPYARFAEREGWAFVHPNFRGANEGPETTGSEEAVQDIVDAVDHAIEEADIDEDAIYVAGFSGGGMMALNVAGQHPDRFSAVVAWAPNYDLVDWHDYSQEVSPDADYLDEIEASCGGDPSADDAAADECLQRSPVSYMDGIAEAGLPVYLGHGLQDDLVPPDYSVLAFDELAAQEDQLGEEVVEAARGFSLPDDLEGEVEAETFFTDEEPDVLFARSSGPVTLVLFDGEHDMAYNPSLEWLIRVP